MEIIWMFLRPMRAQRRSSSPHMFHRASAMKEFAKFTRKQLQWSLIFSKNASPGIFSWILHNLDEYSWILDSKHSFICTPTKIKAIPTSEAATQGFPRKRCSENRQQIYRRTLMPKCDFNKVALQLYWNRFSAWVFSCKFAAYFQNTFSKEHLWVAACANFRCDYSIITIIQTIFCK